MASDCETLDRISPSRRPDLPVAGTQTWNDLGFVHWSFPPEVVRKLVPASLELDLWKGRAWVGIVPFTMKNIRSAWMPQRAGLDFLETNVRTYVHHDREPGVHFFSLEASSWLAVRVARFVWGLPYFFADMETSRDGDRLTWRSTRKDAEKTNSLVELELGDELGASAPGTLEHFLLERYYLFQEHRGRVLKGIVHHVPYPVRRAKLMSAVDGLLGAVGLPGGDLETAHFSSGVDVEVFGPDPV